MKTVLFQIIQFSIRTQFSFIWPIDRTLSGATTPSQSGPGSNGIEEILRIPRRTSFTGTSGSNCLVSLSEHALWRGVLPLCRSAVGVFCSPSWLGWDVLVSYLGLSLGESYSSAEIQSVYSAAEGAILVLRVKNWVSMQKINSYWNQHNKVINLVS